jgi:hypothetical protein
VTHGSLQRSLKILVGVGVLVLSALPLAAQDPIDPLLKLEPKDKFAVDLMIDSANMAGLPSNSLRLMALQGIAKKADGRQIVAAVRRQLNFLRTAREALGPVEEQELTAGASVLSEGAKPAQLATFRTRRKGQNDLEAFVVWTDFLVRKIPTDEAFSAITKLWQDGADDATFHSLWMNVQSDISQGLNPGAALQNRIRETPGRPAPVTTVKPPEGAAGEPKLERI